MKDGATLQADLVVLATGYKGQDHLVASLFGAEVAERVGPIWGFDAQTQELRNMWTRTRQPGLWFTGGAFSQCRICSPLHRPADRRHRARTAGESGVSRLRFGARSIQASLRGAQRRSHPALHLVPWIASLSDGATRRPRLAMTVFGSAAAVRQRQRAPSPMGRGLG